ncbi:MAG: S-layer family protein [Cyanobacteria bacterium J06600_6]
MKKTLLFLLKVSLYSVGLLGTSGVMTNAQITPDGTVNTQVNQNGNVAEITGGETRGDNLFHSFQDLSVETGNEAFFDNASAISNIFSRVTGGDVSSIDGLIRANGSANLFLINPAGILFGENASLDLGGSFYGSSASSMLFENGEFSAVDLDNPPLLTVNAPIGFSFRDNPGDIINRSTNNGVGLEINTGERITFVGGQIDFEGGRIRTSGGSIELGGISEAGTIALNEDGSLTFGENLVRADLNFVGLPLLDTVGTGGGNITLTARNLSSSVGEFDFVNSLIAAGIGENSTSATAPGGDILIDVTEDITLDSSRILNQVGVGAEGDLGNTTIIARNLTLVNGSTLFTNTQGIGNTGEIVITATDSITVDGENPDGSISSISSEVGTQAEGNAGSVTLTTTNVEFTNGGSIFANTRGVGNAGDVNIVATDSVTFNGESANGLPGGLVSVVLPQGEGRSGDLNITTGNLSFINGARIDNSTEGIGDAGLVNIIADNILFSGETQNTFTPDGSGGFFLGGVASSVISEVRSGAQGNAGGVRIVTDNLDFINGGRVSVNTESAGNAGSVEVIASDTITFDGTSDVFNLASGITSRVGNDAVGNGGTIELTANNFIFTRGGRVNASTLGSGDAGSVNLTAFDRINFDGNVGDFNLPTGIFANALVGNGNGGSVSIVTEQLALENGGAIEVSNFDSISGQDSGTGEPGNITIEAQSIDLANQARIDAATQSPTGESGIVDLQVRENITLRDNSIISAQAFERANGGNLAIDARFIIAFPQNNDIIANAVEGNGGNIDITTEGVFGLLERSSTPANTTNDIDASSELNLDGTVSITAPDINALVDAAELPSNPIDSQQTTAQACQVNRDVASKNDFIIRGKGGIPAEPGLPLDSQNLLNSNNHNAISTVPEAIATSQGKIQPARGIKVTESGGIILTAYRTDNGGDRLPEIKRNCGGV